MSNAHEYSTRRLTTEFDVVLREVLDGKLTVEQVMGPAPIALAMKFMVAIVQAAAQTVAEYRKGVIGVDESPDR